MTKIQWTDETWNPVTGCTKVSQGCKHCYAETVAMRFWGDRQFTDVALHYDRLDAPLHWKKPRRVFVASMSDPFHDSVPTEFMDRIFAVMALSPQHSYQLLTKRPLRMLAYASDSETPWRVQRAMDAVAVDAAAGDLEEWRELPGIPYEVSSNGRVRRGERLLKLVEHCRGYRQVALCVNAEPRTELVHRLVLSVFDRPPRDDEEVRHLNGDRSDNRLANLRWGSRDENMADAARHGTAGSWMKSRALLTPEQVSEIRSRRSAGEKIANVASRFGIDKRQVSAIARGNIYKPPVLEWPLPNCWLGVSVEDQQTADERIPLLLQMPAAVRFISAEPLLAPITLGRLLDQVDNTGDYTDPRIKWVIVGGESGPKARPCRVEWIESIVKQCRGAGAPCFVKQLGAFPVWAGAQASPLNPARGKGNDPEEWPLDLRVREYP